MQMLAKYMDVTPGRNYRKDPEVFLVNVKNVVFECTHAYYRFMQMLTT